MRENELVQEGEIVLMCASLLMRGEVSLRGTKMESGQIVFTTVFCFQFFPDIYFLLTFKQEFIS